MSALTLQDVLEFDDGPWMSAADAWSRLSRSIDDAADQFATGTRTLSEAWSKGTGASAAQQKGVAQRNELDATFPPAKRIADAFDQHAYAMKGFRGLAEKIVASARQQGCTVDVKAGTVMAPWTSGLDVDKTDGPDAVALANELTSVVNQARAQDDATAALIGGNAPSAKNGFGGAVDDITRAGDLAKKLKDPTYHPTPEELEEFRKLITKYSHDKAFSYLFLDSLGPKGLLELNGTLALYQLDHPGDDSKYWGFSDKEADAVRDLQKGLGSMLAGATQSTGTKGGPRGEWYTPGEFELSPQWITDLETAGRSKMDIGDPYNPQRHLEGVYGYQLLGPLLHNGDYDARFLSAVGGDMVDFEISQGKNSNLWTDERGENIRLDWTQGHNDNKTPAGYDPMNGLMDAMSRNGAGTRDMLTGVTTYSPDSTIGARLPRLDYLLTDRDWSATADHPGGPGWMAELMDHGKDYKDTALDNFGTALEHATTDERGPQARQIVQSIIDETGIDDLARGGDGNQKADFGSVDLIRPEIRDSMARITASYIDDVNANIGEPSTAGSDNIRVDRTNLVRFLADLGKDKEAHDIVVNAQNTYTTLKYQDILSGHMDPDNDLGANLRAMDVYSRKYGDVAGSLDYGAAVAGHTTAADLDAQFNQHVEDRYKVIGKVVDQVSSQTIGKIPVPIVGDIANDMVGDLLKQAEDQAKHDSTGATTYDVGNALGVSRNAAVGLTEAALYNSGQLDHFPAELLGSDGKPKPMQSWTPEDYDAWQRYKNGYGTDTVGSAGGTASAAYQDGYDWAQNQLAPQWNQK